MFLHEGKSGRIRSEKSYKDQKCFEKKYPLLLNSKLLCCRSWVAASSHTSTSILFSLPIREETLPMEQIRQEHRQLEDGIFVSTSPTSPSPQLCSPLPTLGLRLWHRCLDYHSGSKRGLTKVSMATVQSVNHAAADVSSPSLFPFSPSFFPFSCLYQAPPLSPALMHTFSASLAPVNLKTFSLDQHYFCLPFLPFTLLSCSPLIVNIVLMSK